MFETTLNKFDMKKVKQVQSCKRKFSKLYKILNLKE